MLNQFSMASREILAARAIKIIGEAHEIGNDVCIGLFFQSFQQHLHERLGVMARPICCDIGQQFANPLSRFDPC